MKFAPDFNQKRSSHLGTQMEPSKRMQLTLAALALLAPAAWGLDAWVKCNPFPKSFEVKLGRPNSNDFVAAWGSFHNAINETGFSFLDIYTNMELPDEHQAYAAGFLEGYLTRDLIRMHFNNVWADYCDNEKAYCKRLYSFLHDNLEWMYANVAKYSMDSAYWHQVHLVLRQMQGIEDGQTAELKQYVSSEPDLNVTKTLLLNIQGDVQDLEMALKRRVICRVEGSSSALIKLIPGRKDLYVAHNTGAKYSSMLRILKKYMLPYRQKPDSGNMVPGHTATFSSYPGRVFSGDDFYLLSSGLATMATTIGNKNDVLYWYVTPQSNLEFIRNIVSNRLAFTGYEWAKIFSKYNSGTYNNQWMLVDYKQFIPTAELKDGLLFVLEQLPKYINVTDATQSLRDQTYWASYSVPAFQFIYSKSGWWKLVDKYGDWFTYDRTPRALMFLRDHNRVRDMDSMIKLMRYNDYKNDPLAHCNCTPPFSAENAISARSDLNLADGVYPFPSLEHRAHGGIDMKLVNSTLMSKLEFVAVSGPTWEQQPPFRWSSSGFMDRHEGHPDVWAFEPFVHHWLLMKQDEFK